MTTFSSTQVPTFAPTHTFPTIREPVTSQDLWVSCILYSFAGACIMTAFILLRRSKFFYYRVFYPLYPDSDSYLSDYDRSRRHSRLTPPKRESWVDVFLYIILTPKLDQEVLKHCGLDAYMTLRVAWMAAKLFGVWSILGMLFLAIPYSHQKSNQVKIERVAMANIDVTEPELHHDLFRWIFVCELLMIINVVFLMRSEYEHFIEVRKQYLAKKAKETYTVLVERVPNQLMSKKLLTKYFNSLTGDVRNVELVPSELITAPLQALIDKRELVLIELEKAKKYNGDHESRLKIFTFETKSNLEELRTFNLEAPVGEDLEEVEEIHHYTFDPVLSNYELGVPDPQEIKIPAQISPKAEKMARNVKFARLVKLAQLEKNDNLTFSQQIMSALLYFSCGWLDDTFISLNLVVHVDAETYFESKLESLNLLITWLQYRAEVLTDSNVLQTEHSNEAQILKPKKEVMAHILNAGSFIANDLAPLDLEESENLLERGRVGQTKPIMESLRKMTMTANFPQHKKSDHTAELIDLEETRKEVSQYVSRSAFVTFETKFNANVVSTLSVNEVRDELSTSRAGKPLDMYYDNLGFSTFYKTMMLFLTAILFLIFMLLFGSVVASLAVATNLDNLRGSSKWFDDFIHENEFLVPVFQQVSPLLLVLAFCTVPYFLLFIMNFTKPVTMNVQHDSFLVAYHWFGIIQLFLFYQVSGSVASILGKALDDPLEIINILAETIPNNVIFFMQFVLIKIFVILPVELVRLVDMIFGLPIRRCLTCRSYESESDRERYSIKCMFGWPIQKPVFPILALYIAQALLVFTVGITYSVMAPIMAPIVTIYSFVFIWVFRNQFLFVYATELRAVDSLGSYFSTMMNTFFIAIFLLAATMMGMFAIHQQAALVSISLPLLVMIVLTKMWFGRVYSRDLHALPLSLAKLYDIESVKDRQSKMYIATQNGMSKESYIPKSTKSYDKSSEVYDYRHPVLRAPGAIHL